MVKGDTYLRVLFPPLESCCLFGFSACSLDPAATETPFKRPRFAFSPDLIEVERQMVRPLTPDFQKIFSSLLFSETPKLN